MRRARTGPGTVVRLVHRLAWAYWPARTLHNIACRTRRRHRESSQRSRNFELCDGKATREFSSVGRATSQCVVASPGCHLKPGMSHPTHRLVHPMMQPRSSWPPCLVTNYLLSHIYSWLRWSTSHIAFSATVCLVKNIQIAARRYANFMRGRSGQLLKVLFSAVCACHVCRLALASGFLGGGCPRRLHLSSTSTRGSTS